VKKNTDAQRLNTLTRIKSLYPDISTAERSVADYILGKPEEIYRLNIKQLASKSAVSLPTVHRFARRLGFEGFKDFKVALIRDIGVGLYFSPDDIDQNSTKGIASSLFDKEVSNLRETLANLDYRALEQAAEALGSADRILFFAVSSSVPTAMDFYWKFTMAGFSCFHSPDIYTQTIAATGSRKNDVAVGISFSGGSREVVDCMRIAKQNGSSTVCITTFVNSPITRYSGIRLFTAPVKALYQKIDLPSKISHTAILDVVYLLVLLRDKSRASKYISRAEEELLSHRS
jgi:RpiR family carbohydrate utilization transcriptional regulator